MSQRTRRERHREATMAEIVRVARTLLEVPGGLSLRGVAVGMGITAPALYRYVDNVADLCNLVADAIDRETAATLRLARDRYPVSDPAAQIAAASFAFREWALTHRGEFGLIFTNPHETLPLQEHKHDGEIGQVFHELLLTLWHKYDFPIPAPDSLEPAVLASFSDPIHGFDVSDLAPAHQALPWVFLQTWLALYGTVTMEVYGHCHPAIIRSGALFRQLMADQTERLGFAHELPRLLDEFASQLELPVAGAIRAPQE